MTASAQLSQQLQDLTMNTASTSTIDNINETDEPVPILLQIRDAQVYDRRKVPITLLTGYLGAGKSTLLQYILTAEHGYKIAVCMNDFGDTTDIESKSLTLSNPLAPDEPITSMLSLPNGCLCCSVKDMGIAAIEEMVAKQTDVDWVVVELTGLADPGPVAKSFWSNEEMGDLILDGVVCVVDSRNVLSQLSHTTETECERQIASADVILLNKVDLVSEESLAKVESVVSSINPTLRVHKTTQSRIPLDSLFNLRAFSTPAPSILNINPSNPDDHDHKATCNDCIDSHDSQQLHSHSHTTHKHSITTVLAPLPILDDSAFSRLTSFLEALLWDTQILTPSGDLVPVPIPDIGFKGIDIEMSEPNKDNGTENRPRFEILRTKGFIRTQRGDEYVLQGVADLFEMKPVESANRNDHSVEVEGKVVFIGRGLCQDLVNALRLYVCGGV